MKVQILYEDDFIVAINKPSGVVSHKNEWTKSYETPALQLTRDQIGQHVYSIHRLDRSTSGILLFGKSKECASEIQNLFAKNKIFKTYHALVRGWLKSDVLVNKELDGKESESFVEPLAHLKIDEPVGRYNEARYTLVRLSPKTGRTHQLRRHLIHLNHPIIGDRVRGDRYHNKFFKEQIGIDRLWLFATSLNISSYPFASSSEDELTIHCGISSACRRFIRKSDFVVPIEIAGKTSDILDATN